MPTPSQIRIRAENKHLRIIINSLVDAKKALAYFSGPDEVHEVSEKRLDVIQETIDDLEDIYIARVNAAKRK